jgi:[glutamine synthetase] adenylyltransferase / [glutamine synthetase]-adenylyl-L-tyrosine phosphorylase
MTAVDPVRLPARAGSLAREFPFRFVSAMNLAAELAFSRYASRTLAAHPEAIDRLHATIDAPYPWPGARQALAERVAAGDPAALAVALRALRRDVMLHTIARDLTGRADLAEVVFNATTLAEAALDAASRLHHALLAIDHGEPRDTQGTALQLVVIGMGKLGGSELNVSSDVDLVFTYPREGDTDGSRQLANREFFDRLGRRIIAALHDATKDGFVFRVDMRLRPYGDSGPLTVPYSALEQYLIAQGRAWERYAWLKARALTGAGHDELMSLVLPFVFRKYLDFDAYEGLRDVHRQIREQGRRKDYAPNIKLGPGGIREIEFIVQAMQLVRGGREPGLRSRGTLPALAALAARGLLPEAAVTALRSAYVFLRNLEHRLQYRDDLQTQTLPSDALEREALALAMGYGGTATFDAALAAHRGEVETQFEAVFGDTRRRDTAAGDRPVDGVEAPAGAFAALWRDEASPEVARATLAQAGYADPQALLATLCRVRESGRYLQLPALSRQRFDALVPQLLATASTEAVAGADPQAIFTRLLGLLEAVSRRSAYLALVIEHPPLLPRLAQLMGSSAWAADYLVRHPILLDELLDARVLLAEPDWDGWRRELARLLAVHPGDAEEKMDALRHFQHAQAFRLLAQDLAGMLTVERLADHLSALADIILAATLKEVWALMRGADAPPPRFAVVGYGKLGGKELGYASDLDLVFLYDDPEDQAPERYTRLAQRMITWLTSNTGAGQLYETDLRLRPDGAAGLMVSSLAAFRRYQREHAWVWEHQALTRARFVAGDAAIGAAFEAEREAILRLPRDRAQLAADIVEMRQKMLAGHPNPTPLFDLKHDPGGMVDVEFAVQCLVLAHSEAHAELTRNFGNIALLRIAGELDLLPAEIAAAAADAYRDYRRMQHQIRLTGATHARVDPADHVERRAAVNALWRAVFGQPWR